MDDHRFVRDVDGRLTFLLLAPADPEKVRSLDAESMEILGSYATVPAVTDEGDLLDPSLADDFTVQELVDVAARAPVANGGGLPSSTGASWGRTGLPAGGCRFPASRRFWRFTASRAVSAGPVP